MEDLGSMEISKIFSVAFSEEGAEVEAEEEVEVEEEDLTLISEEVVQVVVLAVVSEINKNSPRRKNHISIIPMFTR